jgi:transcriptional regulator with XRE-family HTH domain
VNTLGVRKIAGKNLRNLRLARGYTQAEVSKALCITEGFLSFLESGVRTGSLDTYRSLADFFEVPLWQLFAKDALPSGKEPAVDLRDLTLANRRLVAELVTFLKT